jgi:hypothetical protein
MRLEVAEAIVNLQLELRKLQEMSAGSMTDAEVSKRLSEISLIAFRAALIGVQRY